MISLDEDGDGGGAVAGQDECGAGVVGEEGKAEVKRCRCAFYIATERFRRNDLFVREAFACGATGVLVHVYTINCVVRERCLRQYALYGFVERWRKRAAQDASKGRCSLCREDQRCRSFAQRRCTKVCPPETPTGGGKK